MYRIILIVLLFVYAITPASAQSSGDKILLMSGKFIEAKVDTSDEYNLYYILTKKNGKEKARSVELERVFATYDASGAEKLYYAKDDARGQEFTVEEMRDFIRGEQDARRVHKSNWVWLVVTPVSAVGTYIVAQYSVASFAVPPVTMLGSLIPRYNVKKDKLNASEESPSEAYLIGYQEAAKGRRVVKATFAALLGGAAGVIALGTTR